MYLTACSSAQSDHYIEIIDEAKDVIDRGEVTNMNQLADFIVGRLLFYER